ncbi:histidine kinase [Roseivivax sediminis]|uniref:Two-component system, NarL family, sensor histidine kinase UhpB n=1 Tax=Roseivivax sediminis TaxID=936889 RepID=A0A1I1WJ99_9RHOB|nr:histidine kinase [Roseivivax sediminis]SFD94458.1 two-component system, NarL family, sensor histidine kinase UhpB [Roseivivax sediminis]
MFRRMKLGRQILLCVVVVQCAGLALGATTLVRNAREAVEVEIAASEQSARAMVLAAVGATLRDGASRDVMTRLSEIIVEPRHVDIVLLDAQSGPVNVRPAVAEEDEMGAVPDWFTRLVEPRPRETRIPVRANGTVHGFVTMTTAPADEIAEVWKDATKLIWIVMATVLLQVLLLGFLVRRALGPLDALRAAMRRLRDGDLAARVARPASRDLAPIFEGFNALTEGLARADTERARLARRVVELGDDERRAIAMELHDEFGPCLFGLKVKASALLRGARASGDAKRAADAEAILEIVEQIQASNARLLTTLRPMAIGQLPLLEAVADLFDAFRRTHPDIDWDVHLPADLPRTHESVDLTVYRFFQEATTNALRHGTPDRIRAELAADASDLLLVVEDDGSGIAADADEGRGLTGMRDRIGSLGGQLAIGRGAGGGARLDARMPQEVPAARGLALAVAS